MDRDLFEKHIVKINPKALFADGYDRAIRTRRLNSRVLSLAHLTFYSTYDIIIS